MRAFWADMAKQIWVMIGLFSAWMVMTGSAKKAEGIAIIIGIIVWVVSHRLRIPKNRSDEDE